MLRRTNAPRAAVRAVLALAGVLALWAAAGPLGAQEVKPGPEHAVLKEGEGTWEAAIVAQGSEWKGTLTARVALNGLWLLEEFQGDFGGMPFEGRGSTTYDPAKKKYVNVWIDSMSASPMISEGSYDRATRTLTMTGSMKLPDGSDMKVTQTTVTRDANTRIFTLKGAGPDGAEFEMMKVTYTRKPAK